MNKFLIDGSACAFDFEIENKMIQHVQILIGTCIYCWYRVQGTRKVILWPVMTLQAGQLGSVPSQVQHISAYCGICIGFLACLVVYSVGTSCKIPATARGFSLIHNIETALVQHSLLFND